MRTFAQKQNQPQRKSSTTFTKSNRSAPAASHEAHPLLHLQRTIGNQAVLRLLQANVDGLKAASDTEVRSETPATTRFAHDFSRIPVHAPAPITIQPKLAVSTPGDIYEQEADKISEQVMRMPEPQLQRACACGGGCPKCQTGDRGHGHERVQTKHVNSSDSGQTAALPIVDQVLASPGQALDGSLRGFFEPRFGHDFSKVRVHSGPVAEQSTRDVNANAYTVGNDIVFGAGRFSPETQEGRRLMAHELTHVVQQSGVHGSLANQRHAQRDLFPLAQERAKLVRTDTSAGTQRMLQRDMGFEFQTKNFVIGDKGRKFPRKLGGFLHKVPPTDKNGVELQTDTGSVAEFETHHFRKWSDLQVQIQNAVDIVKEINKDPKAFPFNQAKRLEKENLLKKGEKLEVDVKDSSFVAAIQSTEGFALEQYESSLKEHEETTFVGPIIKSAQNILIAAQKANSKIGSGAKLDNLRGFLQVILSYIQGAQARPSKATRVSPVKARFTLMSRTQFSAMFKSVLNADEQTLFRDIVKSGAIPTELGLAATDQFFPDGYWGHFGDMWALFQGGKVVALATEDKKTIHDCSQKTKTAGIDSRKCGANLKDTEITIAGWLDSIVKPKGGADVLSPPPHGGSESMGKFPVRPTGEEKGLVVFETRGETGRKRSQPANKWVDWAEEVFRQAAVCRARPGTGTELIYDGSKKPFDPKKCP